MMWRATSGRPWVQDRAVLDTRPVEIFRSSLEEVQRVALMGRPML